MGLVTQGLLVGIYFAVSRYYDGSRSIWWIAGITAGIVTLIGLLNRLDIDVLGTFRGMENGEWNRTQLLSTIGERFRELDSWSMYLITAYEQAEKDIGRKADKNRKIYNGMMKTYFYQFMGPKPPKPKKTVE